MKSNQTNVQPIIITVDNIKSTNNVFRRNWQWMEKRILKKKISYCKHIPEYILDEIRIRIRFFSSLKITFIQQYYFVTKSKVFWFFFFLFIRKIIIIIVIIIIILWWIDGCFLELTKKTLPSRNHISCFHCFISF